MQHVDMNCNSDNDGNCMCMVSLKVGCLKQSVVDLAKDYNKIMKLDDIVDNVKTGVTNSAEEFAREVTDATDGIVSEEAGQEALEKMADNDDSWLGRMAKKVMGYVFKFGAKVGMKTDKIIEMIGDLSFAFTQTKTGNDMTFTVDLVFCGQTLSYTLSGQYNPERGFCMEAPTEISEKFLGNKGGHMTIINELLLSNAEGRVCIKATGSREGDEARLQLTPYVYVGPRDCNAIYEQVDGLVDEHAEDVVAKYFPKASFLSSMAPSLLNSCRDSIVDVCEKARYTFEATTPAARFDCATDMEPAKVAFNAVSGKITGTELCA